MRAQSYINRMVVNATNKKADPIKLARQVEHTLNMLNISPAGQEAITLVKDRLLKSKIGRLSKRK